MSASSDNDKAAQALQQETHDIQELVANDNLADAQKRLDALSARTHEADGSFSSKQAETAYNQAQQTVDSCAPTTTWR